MRILLAGQKRFGRDTFDLLAGAGHEIAAVVCPPDALRWACESAGVKVIEAGTLRAALVPRGTDLIVAAHSHEFIGRKTRDAARLGAIGYHPSLLPLHRGREAIAWAIKMREPVTGGSIYWLNDTVDGGPVAAQDWCFIRPGDDARGLWCRELAPMGLRLFAKVLRDIERGDIVRTPQDVSLATWEPSCHLAPRLYRPEIERLEYGNRRQ